MPRGGYRPLIDRESIYRTIYDYADRNGYLTVTQREMSNIVGMSYQAMSEVFSEFIDMGMISKSGRKFQIMYDPDEIPWDGKYKALRATYVKSEFYRNGANYGA